MNNLWLSPYRLEKSNGQEGRPGYLLRLGDSQGNFGYSDIFPWSEFGDPEFFEIPSLLKSDIQSPLLKRSLTLAERDLRARKEGHSLLKGRQVFSHFHLPILDHEGIEPALDAIDRGFEKIKIKVGRDFPSELERIRHLCSEVQKPKFLRLDFNNMATKEHLLALENFKQYTEFVEDPFGDFDQWNCSNLVFAFDQPGFDIDKVQVDWQIVKPAKQSASEIKVQNVVFTSYMGHPVGMAHGVCEALSWGKQINAYGFSSHDLYEKTPFSEQILTSGAEISFEPGLGIGFSDLLSQLEWQTIL